MTGDAIVNMHPLPSRNCIVVDLLGRQANKSDKLVVLEIEKSGVHDKTWEGFEPPSGQGLQSFH